VAGIVSDFRTINGQRGRLGLFKLDDKSAVLDARVEEALFNAHRSLFKDDELLIAMVKVMPDRFSGGVQLQVQQVWSLEAARCRFGKYLRVAVNGHAPDVRRLVAEHPPKREMTEQGELVRGLPVRLVLRRQGPDIAATAELQLGDDARFYPSDAALALWMAQADQGQAVIVYE